MPCKQRRLKPQSKSALPALQARRSSHRKHAVVRWKYGECQQRCKRWDECELGCNFIRCSQNHFTRLCEVASQTQEKPGLNSCLTSAELTWCSLVCWNLWNICAVREVVFQGWWSVFFFLFFFVYNNSALRQGYINSIANMSMYPLNYKILQ